MSIAGSGRKLSLLTLALNRRWQQTKAYWHDEKSRQFEEETIDFIQDNVKAAGEAIDKLDTLIARIRHDCE